MHLCVYLYVYVHYFNVQDRYVCLYVGIYV